MTEHFWCCPLEFSSNAYENIHIYPYSDWEEIYCQWAIFSFFLMILKFSMGHFLTFCTYFNGLFSKLMGLWRMAPCLPNHCPYKQNGTKFGPTNRL